MGETGLSAKISKPLCKALLCWQSFFPAAWLGSFIYFWVVYISLGGKKQRLVLNQLPVEILKQDRMHAHIRFKLPMNQIFTWAFTLQMAAVPVTEERQSCLFLFSVCCISTIDLSVHQWKQTHSSMLKSYREKGSPSF